MIRVSSASRAFLSCLVTAASLQSEGNASITGFAVVSYTVTGTDFGCSDVTVNVQDLYMTSNDSADVMLNVYNLTLGGTASGITYFQSFTGTGWMPTNLGGPFDTAALQSADSFVTIGGFDFANPLQTPGAGAGTGLDPNFGGNTAGAPGALAGWYNGNPPSLNGQVGDTPVGLGVLVGRFTYAGDFWLGGTTLEATWNQGLGTQGQQAGFTTAGGGGDGGGGGWGGCSLAFDLNHDGTVDGGDLGDWLSLVDSECGGLRGDFNQDGELSGEDLGLLLNAWGTACRHGLDADPGMIADIEQHLPPGARLRSVITGVPVPRTGSRSSAETRTPDLNRDGVVDQGDLDMWLQIAEHRNDERADLDGDGRASGADLGRLLSAWDTPLP
jgi:hypothetical protein